MFLIYIKKDYSTTPLAIVEEESVAKAFSNKIGANYEPVPITSGESLNYIMDKSYFELRFTKSGEFYSSKQYCYARTIEINHTFSRNATREDAIHICCWATSIEEALSIARKCLPLISLNTNEEGIILKDTLVKLTYR